LILDLHVQPGASRTEFAGKHGESDEDQRKDPADDDPQQPEPERTDLPAEVGLEPGPGNFVFPHVVQHDSNDPRNDERQDRACRLQRVNHRRQRLQALLVTHR